MPPASRGVGTPGPGATLPTVTASRSASDPTVYAPRGLVCSVDQLASAAGVGILAAGGSAADAAVATSAVLAVTTQHMCGLGGDLFALVHDGSDPEPAALAAVGRAGSGADPAALRAEGHRQLPTHGDVRSVTVPGCVDGWLALHGRFGRLPLAGVLAPARHYAAEGFPASPLLAAAIGRVRDLPGAEDYRRKPVTEPGDLIRRPRMAIALDAIVQQGREGFYQGIFGRGLVELSGGLFTASDLRSAVAQWVQPLVVNAWGHRLWTVPPPSQGYLTLAGARIADGLDLPANTNDPSWAHLLSEAARWAGYDRPAVLFDGADGAALVADERLDPRRAAITDRRRAPAVPTDDGGTIHLCTMDDSGMGVSLIQSNAAGWGAHLIEPGTGIFLQDRGIGFSLEPGHPAELAPGRRPPHTLSPALVTGANGELTTVLGTMGGDIQPQVLLQLLARMLHSGQTPGVAMTAPRWTLGEAGFATWPGDGPQVTNLEAGAPTEWTPGLTKRGHRVLPLPSGSNVGHAQVITRRDDGMLAGASDPRAITGAAIGW